MKVAIGVYHGKIIHFEKRANITRKTVFTLENGIRCQIIETFRFDYEYEIANEYDFGISRNCIP